MALRAWRCTVPVDRRYVNHDLHGRYDTIKATKLRTQPNVEGVSAKARTLLSKIQTIQDETFGVQTPLSGYIRVTPLYNKDAPHATWFFSKHVRDSSGYPPSSNSFFSGVTSASDYPVLNLHVAESTSQHPVLAKVYLQNKLQMVPGVVLRRKSLTRDGAMLLLTYVYKTCPTLFSQCQRRRSTNMRNPDTGFYFSHSVLYRLDLWFGVFGTKG